MNIDNLTSDLSGTARNVAKHVGEAFEHGRDVIGGTRDAGVSKASAAVDRGTSAVRTLASVLGAYASIKTLTSAIDASEPVARALGSLGLRRRPTTLSRVLTGVGLFAAGAAAGAGVALLLAPQPGEKTRAQLLERARTLRDDARGVAHDVGEAARTAAHTVEETATHAASEASAAAQNLVGTARHYGASTTPEGSSTGRPSNVSRAPRAR